MGPASCQTVSPVESVPFWISKLIDSFCSLLLWLLVIDDNDGWGGYRFFADVVRIL